MSNSYKRILFYNAIPMPHSILLHKALLENGYDVHFWYYKDLTSLYPWKYLDSDNDYFIYGRDDNNLRKLITNAVKSDLVIITGTHTIIHVFLAIICFLFRIKYAYWLDVSERPRPGLKKIINRILLWMTDYLLVTGHEGIKRISSWNNLGIAKFRDFPYLGALVNDDEMIETNKARSNSINGNGNIKILICNRFEKRKGYDCVFNAFKIIQNVILNNISLTMIGSGTQFKFYKDLFNDLKIKVNLKFWVEYEEYLKHLKESDILIHASSHEPFGIPPIDAMAHGKLVIASDGVMSTIDRISNGKNGFIFKANDPAELAEILKLVFCDPQLIYRLGDKAFIDSKQYQLKYNLDTLDEIISSK